MLNRKLVVIAIFGILLVGGLGLSWRWLFQPKEEILDPTLKRIFEQGKIIVGTDATYAPMEYIDEKDNFAGFDIDLAKEIAYDLEVNVEFKHINWDEIFNTLIREEVDMLLSSITILPERMEIMSFSNPYFNAGQVIVIRKDSSDIIKGTEDLSGKKLGVQMETTSESEAKKYTNEVSSYLTYDAAKKELLAKKLDAIIADYPAAIGLARDEENLIIVGEPFTVEFYGVAVRKEDKLLLEKINSTIARLKRENKLKEIEKKWLW